MADLLGRVLRGTVGRELKGVKEELKDFGQGAASDFSGGLVGKGTAGFGAGQQEGGRPGARPTSPTAGDGSGVNATTRNFLNRFTPAGMQQQQAPTVTDTLTSIPGRLLNSVMPSEQNVDRLKRGAAAMGAAVDRVTAAGSSVVQGGVQAVRDSAQPIAQTKEEIESALAQQRPVIDLPEPAKPSLFQQGLNWLNRVTASAATAATIATTPAAAGPEAPPTKPTAAQIEAAVSQQRPVVELQEPEAGLQTFAVPLPQTSTPTPSSTVSDKPAVTASVSPTEQFATAAAGAPATPAKPSITAHLDSMIDNEKDAGRLETLARARAQIHNNYGGPTNG